MKIVTARQLTPEWEAARVGIPTASNFAKILTPAGKVSAQADGYMHQLVAERLLGYPVNIEANAWMERGTITESEAVAFYELAHGIDTTPVGFITTDDGIAGCSADRLIGDDGGLELKCPSAAVHVGYLLEVEPRRYWPQIQGALWITGRAWWDFLSYCPGLPPAEIRFARDEEFIDSLERVVRTFAERVDANHRKLAEMIGRASAA